MTVKAGRALPTVAWPTFVLIIHFGLVVLMAENTLKDRIIRRIHMAVIAVVPFPSMLAGVDWEVLRVMIPICRCPCRSRVTSLAVSRETRSRMARRCGATVCILMARETQRRCSNISTRVAGDTHQSNMCARKREAGRAVVECRRLPGSGRVTLSA